MGGMSPVGVRRTPTTVYRKAEAHASDLSVTAVLTTFAVDKAGDLVHPSGLSFKSHIAAPWVDLEHNGTTAGWARKSLSRPGGSYGLAWGDFGVDGRLPVGTTWFDPSDPFQSQVFALVERDALPGVSLEFRPVDGFYKAIGRSELEGRPAYEFFKADVVRWTHCARPVNDGAWTVTKSHAPDPLLSILSAGRLPGGEQLHPTVKKALAPYAPKRRVFRTVEKSMNDEAETVYDDAPEATPGDAVPEAAPGAEAPAGGGIAALYTHAQTLIDACEQLASDMMSSDSPELRKFGEKLKAKGEALAEEAKAMADKHDAKLNGGGGGDETPEADGDDAPADVDMDTDDEGVLKAMRPVYRKAVKARRGRRFSKAEALAAVRRESSAADKAAAAELARARAELDAERRKFRRDLLVHGGS